MYIKELLGDSSNCFFELINQLSQFKKSQVAAF